MNAQRHHFRQALLAASACVLASSAHAQSVITKTSGFGGAGTITSVPTNGMSGPQTISIPANAGQQVGTNLFHSFTQFDVALNDTAKFTPTGSTSAINNIIARIYSANPSMINGNLLVDPTGNFAGANLFLINPKGVVFGANSSVSVPGDFVVSTANYVKLNDGTGVFYSDPTTGTDILTSAPVSAFGFFQGTTPNSITVNGGANLVAGGSLQFISGAFTAGPSANLSVSNATLGIFSGGATSSTVDATVPYLTGSTTDYSGAANFSQYGTIKLGTSTTAAGATLAATGTGGAVVIRGGHLVQQGTGASLTASSRIAIQADNFDLSGSVATSTAAGTIGIDTTSDSTQHDVTLTGGTITATGGSITLGASSLVNLTLDSASSITETGGSGGVLSVSSTGAVQNGGTISTSGSTDSLQIHAATLSLMTGSSVTTSGAALTLGTTGDLSLATGATVGVTNGSTGTLSINSGSTIESGGTISTKTSALNIDSVGALTLTGGTITSQGGSITLGQAHLGGLSLDGMSSITETTGSGGTLGIKSTGAIMSSGTISTVGSADVLKISGPSLALSGTVSTGTAALGIDTTGATSLTGGTISSQGGAITMGHTNLGSLSLNSTSQIKDTGTGAEVLSINTTGVLSDNGTISTASAGGIAIDSASSVTLASGNITSSNGDIVLGGNNPIGGLTLTGTSLINQTGTGAINVTSSGDVSLTGGVIKSQTSGVSAAGDVTIASAGTVSLDSGGAIESITTGSGNAGDVAVEGNVIDIGVNSASGTITLTPEIPTGATAALTYISNTGILSLSEGQATGSAGNVTVTSTNTDALANAVQLLNGGQIGSATTTGSNGNAGNVTIFMNSGALVAGVAQSASVPVLYPVIFSTATGSEFPNDGTIAIAPQATGTIPTYSITLESGASIQTVAMNGNIPSGNSTPGNISILAGNLTLDPSSSIESDVNDNGDGDTGSISVVVQNDLRINSGAFIETQLLTPGSDFQVGSVFVATGQLFLGTSTTPVPPSQYQNLNGSFFYNSSDYAPTYITRTFDVQQVTNGTSAHLDVEEDFVEIGGSKVSGATVETLGSGSGGSAASIAAQEQIILDGKLLSGTPDNLLLGTSGTIAPSPASGTSSSYTYTINTSDGVVVGNQNLFLSFSEFNLASNEKVVFVAPGLDNILARITGTTASTIDGTLAEAVGTTAHLFLMNPYGFIFNNSNQTGLQLNGALTVTSATSMNFGSGTFYSSGDLTEDGDIKLGTGFTGNVASFRFDSSRIALASTFGDITLQDANFSSHDDMHPVSSIQLIGGDIALNNSSFLSANTIVLYSTSSASGTPITVPLDSSGNPLVPSSGVTSLGDVSLTNNSILLSTEAGASKMYIASDTFELNDSFIINEAISTTSPPGEVMIQADTATISATGTNAYSFISTANLLDGTDSSVDIDAENLTINANDSTAVGIISTAQPGQTFDLAVYNANGNGAVAAYVPVEYAGTESGNAGPINLNLSGTLLLENNGILTAATDGLGMGGTITIDGLAANNAQGLPAGNPQVIVKSSGNISSSTSLFNAGFTHTGAAGSVLITASSLSLTGLQSTIISTAGLPTTAADTPSAHTGDGGTIDIDISGMSATSNPTNFNDTISITDGGTISASSYTVGTGGTIAIGQTSSPSSLLLDGAGSGIFAQASGEGDGGSIAMTVAGDVVVSNGGQITASTAAAATGSSGEITITQSGSTDLADPATNPTTIGGLYVNGGSISTAADGIGTATPSNPNAGNIILNTQALTLAGAGTVTSSTLGLSNGGSITVNGSAGGPSQFVQVTGGGMIASNTGGTGHGGAISINTGALSVSGAGSAISTDATAGTGGGGSIAVTVTGQAGVVGSTGDVKLTGGGSISAASQTSGEAGTVTIAQSGSVDLADPATNPTVIGGLYLQGGSISTAASGTGTATPLNPNAGNITLTTQALTMDDGAILSSTAGASKAGDITINGVAGNAPVQFVLAGNGSVIDSNTSGAGDGGTISVTSGALTVTGSSSTISTSATAGTGGGGSINLAVTGNPGTAGSTGDVKITGGGSISASSETTGEAGTVTITQSGSRDITNPAANGGLYLNDGVITTAADGLGTATPVNPHAGDIALNTQALTATGGSLILSSTSGHSKAGDVTIGGPVSGQPTQSVVVEGGAKIASETGGVNGSGAGGTITVRTGSLLVDAASISTSTTGGSGNGGDISITAIAPSSSVNSTVTLQDGGTIVSASNNSGSAGMIAIQSDLVTVNGAGSAISTNAGAIGNAGNTKGEIVLTGVDFLISNSGQISATTGGFSPGGSITIKASNEVVLTANARLDASSTAGTGGANGGSILIGSDPSGSVNDYGVNSPVTVSLSDGSVISCDSQNTNGGDIAINTGQLLMQDNSLISTNEPNGAANTLGGDITIRADTLFYLNHYSFINSDAGQGTGGNIRVDPEFVILDHSGINAVGGAANGNVYISSTYVLSSESSILATGTVNIDSLPLDLTGSLLPLPANLTDEEKRLREKCARAVNHEFSSFIVVGRGGTESAPEELQPDFGMDDEPFGFASSVKNAR